MPTATIVAEYVNPPKPGKKQGSVKGNDGHYYGVDPSQLGQFTQGGTYTIEYDTRIFQGKEYRNFRRMDGVAPQTASKPSTSSSSHTKSVEMACMGIVGRAVQGVGTVPDGETLMRWFMDIRSAWIATFTEDGPEF